MTPLFRSRAGRIVPGTLGVLGLAVLGFAGLSGQAQAQDENFYKGKTINLYIGFAPGGSYDLFGRMVARHLGRHIPGHPAIVAQNMPGAGSFKEAAFLYSVAPKDGTAIGIISQTAPLEEALKNPGVKYKSTEFNWIGRATSNVELTLVWHTSKAGTIEDAKKYPIPVASTGPGSPSDGYPRLLNGLIGTNFKIITGYTGSTSGLFAMEKGEVDGALTSWNTIKGKHAAWLKDKKINILVQYTRERSPELPDVPAVVELAKTDEGRRVLATYASGGEIGRSFLTTPGVPAERVAILREAFSAMVKDPKLLAEVKQARLDFFPLDGEKLQKLVAETVDVPPAIVKKMQDLLQGGSSK